jgi:hypothetical protein
MKINKKHKIKKLEKALFWQKSPFSRKYWFD